MLLYYLLCSPTTTTNHAHLCDLTQMASQDFITAMLGRVLIGLGVGLGLAIDPLYISEMSPPPFRGSLVSYSECMIGLGITMGYIAD